MCGPVDMLRREGTCVCKKKDSPMAAMNKPNVAEIIEFLETNRTRGGDVTLSDVMQLAEVMTGSMREFLTHVQPAITSELTAIADEIRRMKTEISQLRANDMKQNRIPEAGLELDAIVEATESATHTIMESAESIMSSEIADADAYRAFVNDKMIEIFEACAFQDITGQRISKVVQTLSYIDERVTAFVERMRMAEDLEEPLPESEADVRRRKLILHGPQRDGQGVSQDDVDQMLSETSGQDAIDQLFD